MIMKNIMKYLAGAALFLSLSACSLFERPEAYASKEDIFASEDGLQA